MLEVFFPTYIEFEDHDKSKMIRYEVRSVTGPVEHNLLSVHSLTRMGATFQFGPESCSIQVSDIRRIDCNIWANVPWIRAHRRKGRGSSGSSSGDIEKEHSLTQETWPDSSPSQQGSKSPISPDTSFRMSELPSKPCSPKPHMVVHAKVPDSIAALVPEVTRFVPAAYLHLRQNSLARMVSSKIGSDIRIFQAEVKPLSQLVWDPSLAPDIIKAVEREGFQIASPDPPMDLRAQDDKVGISESLPMNGPPRAWIREHGPNCSACNSSSRHGRKHPAHAVGGTGIG